MTTRKKLEGNGWWESSRMMLPEHKETITRRHGIGLRSMKLYLLDENIP